jgi:Tfp pilus assembly protein PilV
MKSNKTGAILLEAILGLIVFTMVVLSVIPMISFLLRRTEQSKYEAQAAILLQESLEASYSVLTKDTGNWQRYVGQYEVKRGVTNWVLTHSTSDAAEHLQTRFDRKLTIRTACRDNSGVITNMDNPGCDGGTPDRDTKILLVEITWDEGDTPKSLTSNLVLVNY